MKRKLLGACSLIKVMTGESGIASASWIDLPESLASLISEYQIKLQYLQLAIIAAEPDDRKEIGHCFEKLEKQIEKLQNYAKGVNPN